MAMGIRSECANSQENLKTLTIHISCALDQCEFIGLIPGTNDTVHLYVWSVINQGERKSEAHVKEI